MRHARHRPQNGFVLIAVVIIVLGAAAFVLHSVNASAWRADRHQVTHQALLKAKEALVARAVTDDNRPGSLPCPDTDNDGQAELFAGNACPSYVGRLPWQTLGLPDLRDGSGERLWYVLSPSHRDHPAAEPINSNTGGLLNMVGSEPAAGLLAVVVAPGQALLRAGAAATQNRDCSVPANCLNAVNYLDISGTDNAVGGPNLIQAAESDSFNDRLMAVRADDVMPLVEKRAGREFAQKLRDHFDTWQAAAGKGFYPWAVPFNDPSLVAQSGTSPTVQGLLPSAVAPLVWTSASAGCAGVGTNEITCTGIVFPPFIPLLNLSGSVGNLASGLYDAPSAGNLSYDAGLVLLGATTSTWTVNPAAEALDFSYSGTGVGVGVVVIRVRAPDAIAWSGHWLIANRWYQTAYYALSSGYAINGAGACGGVAPACLTVGNTLAPNNDKQAVVTMTGRALSAQPARPVAPPAALADYLEGENQTPADLIFGQNMRDTTFNDQPVVVRP